MNNEHTLLCIMGRTASGKDRLVTKLCETMEVTQVISYTTRPRRNNEGDTHIFVTDAEYEEMKTNNQIAAFTEIAGNKYWSTIEQLYENSVYIIDPVGVQSLRQLKLPNLRIVTVFINVPDNIREHRALNIRHDDKNTFRVRNYSEKHQFEEMLRSANFDYAIQNIKFPEAFSTLKWICDAEGLWKNKEEEDDNRM